VGITSGTSITGAYTVTGGGETVTADSSAFLASVDAAWTAAFAPRDDAQPMPASDIGGLTFTAGTYRSASTIAIASDSDVTFDAQGDADAKFLMQVVASFSAGERCNILLANGAKAENIVWVVNTFVFIGANTIFKGTIMAKTITFDANVVHEGSIFAQESAITLGAGNHVTGCVVAKTAITFGTFNTVTFEQAPDPEPEPEVKDIPAIAGGALPSLANDKDQVILACLPLIETPTAACADASGLEADMLTLLNNCTNAALPANYTRRRASGIDTPQVADTVIVPFPTFNQPGGPSRRLRGERRLWTTCTTTGYISLINRLVCCTLADKPSFCGSLTNDARRKLEEDGPDLTAAQVEAILPDITLSCTEAYVTFASNQHPGCFAEIGDESSLECAAIMMTGGTA
jgi:hypothetical protein